MTIFSAGREDDCSDDGCGLFHGIVVRERQERRTILTAMTARGLAAHIYGKAPLDCRTENLALALALVRAPAPAPDLQVRFAQQLTLRLQYNQPQKTST